MNIYSLSPRSPHIIYKANSPSHGVYFQSINPLLHYRDLIRVQRRGSDPAHGTFKYPSIQREADPFLLETLSRYVKPGEIVLELGCNAGNNLLALAKKGYVAYGVDAEVHCLEQLVSKAESEGVNNRVKVAAWDFARNGDVPWKEIKGKVKAIYMIHVGSHLSGKCFINTLRKIAQTYLAPGGVLVLTTIDEAAKLRQRDAFALNMGYVKHSKASVEAACTGLKQKLSRPFHKGELAQTLGTAMDKRLYGDLLRNETKLRWYVHQKPL